MIELTPQRLLELKAMRFALKAHGTQKYGNHQYSYHLGQVVESVKHLMVGDPLLSTYIAIAWLHDTLEDTETTFKELHDEFGLAIAAAVFALTKREGLEYTDYLVACCENSLARNVKICDTLCNLNESFKTLNQKGMNKYPKQLTILMAGAWAGQLVLKEILNDQE